MTENAENTNIPLLDWNVLISSGVWPLDRNEPTIEAPERSAREPEDVSDVEWAALTLANVFAARLRQWSPSNQWFSDLGRGDREAVDAIAAAVWQLGRATSSIFAVHSNRWAEIAEAIEASDAPEDRKRLYRRVAEKA
jgi:hypothetical protein